MLNARPIQNDVASPRVSPSPNSIAAVGKTTYISESPMIAAVVGETAHTIPAGMIDPIRPPEKRLLRTPRSGRGTSPTGVWPFSYFFTVVKSSANTGVWPYCFAQTLCRAAAP